MTWKDIIKQDIKAKILAEIKKEGGALGMKNLKQFGEEAEIKQALAELEKDGDIFMHKDGDIYTHKPKPKFSSYKSGMLTGSHVDAVQQGYNMKYHRSKQK